MAVPLDAWIDRLDADYLDDYVAAGGAAVKLAVSPDVHTGPSIAAGALDRGRQRGYVTAMVDASVTRIHMIQDVFHAVARQIDWIGLAEAVVRECYETSGLSVPDDDVRVASVAAALGEEPAFLTNQMNRQIRTVLDRGHEMVKEFRWAMRILCSAIAADGPEAPQAALVVEWLRGDLKFVGALKEINIYRRIGRHNARAMLSSTGAFCRLAGSTGLTLVLDIRQLGVPRRADVAPGTVYYTAAAVLDAYEVLRQLIDATDDLVGVMCVVVTDPRLFGDDRRSVRVYKALFERVWPDVRVRERTNPVSALVEIGPA